MMDEYEYQDSSEPEAEVRIGDGAMPVMEGQGGPPIGDGAMPVMPVMTPQPIPLPDAAPMVVEVVEIPVAAADAGLAGSPLEDMAGVEVATPEGAIGDPSATPVVLPGVADAPHWATQYPYAGGVTPSPSLGPIERLDDPDVSFSPTDDLAQLIAHQEATAKRHAEEMDPAVTSVGDESREGKDESAEQGITPDQASPLPAPVPPADAAPAGGEVPQTPAPSDTDKGPTEDKTRADEDKKLQDSLDYEYPLLSNLLQQEHQTMTQIMGNI